MKITRLTLPAALIIFASLFVAFTNKTDNNDSKPTARIGLAADTTLIDTLNNALNQYNKRLPAEKVYLQTDKPYYNLGDTLWFKAYILNGKDFTPTHQSGLLYVELNDDTTSNVRRVSLVIKDGVAWGQIPLLSKIFREGGYTLRAYTNWMQNFGNDYLFTRRIYIGTSSAVKWLVTSDASLNKNNGLDEVKVDIKLNRIDKLFSPIALKKMQVKLFDDWHWVYKETMQTGIDGSLKFGQLLKEKTKVANMHVEITSLEKADNGKVVQVPLTLVKTIDVQFLPEGGHLVAGLKCTVGFKALSDNGKGTQASGVILDLAGKQVAAFSTLHNGMGSFEFTPKAGEKYTARLSSPNQQTFNLPAVKPEGTVMHIVNSEQGNLINISVRNTANHPLYDSCYLAGTSGGVLYYAQVINPNHPDIAIAKKNFPTGIARFTLFKGKQPLNERAVFIDHQDGLNIKITPDKSSYAKRDSVNLAIQVSDAQGFPVKGSFSVAVTDNAQVKADTIGNDNIQTSLLLNAGLKGHIEEPGYYINRKDKRAWQALDNLLLTQGWTGYDWTTILSAQKKAPAFEVEKSIKVTGYVSNISKKPLINHQVIMSSQKPFFITATYTDSAGIYKFDNLPRIDSGSFFIQANNKNGRKIVTGNINVKNFIPAKVDTYQSPLIPWYVNTDSTMINHLKRKINKAEDESYKLSGNVLQEVKIKETKIIKNSFWDPGFADIVYDEKDIKESAMLNLYELLKQKIPGFRVVNNWKRPYGGLAMTMRGEYRVYIQIDGWGLPIHIDDPYSAEELIAEISEIKNVILTGLELKTTTGTARIEANVAVQLTTRNGRGWYKLPKTGTVTYRPIPLMYPQQFYSPKYNIKLPTGEVDNRETLFWEPNMITDAEGRANISFYTSDSPDKFTVKIAGADANGNLGDAMIKLNTASKEGN